MPEEGRKDDQGKPPLELLDRFALEETAKVMGFGEKKYGANNWRSGLSQRRTLGAALRHIFTHLDGETLDPETNLLHLAHAMCELMFAIRMLKDRPDLDDRYKSQRPQTGPEIEYFMKDIFGKGEI